MKKEFLKEDNGMMLCFMALFSLVFSVFAIALRSILLGIFAVVWVVCGLYLFVSVFKKNRMHNKMIKEGVRVKAEIEEFGLKHGFYPYLHIKCHYFNKERGQMYLFEDGSYLDKASNRLYSVLEKQNKIEVPYNPENAEEYYIFIEESAFVWNRSI